MIPVVVQRFGVGRLGTVSLLRSCMCAYESLILLLAITIVAPSFLLNGRQNVTARSTSWCQALAGIPGLMYPLACYGVELPARSTVPQPAEAEPLASLAAQRTELSISASGGQCPLPRHRLTPRGH